MLIALGALETVPPYAVVPEHVVDTVLRDLCAGAGQRHVLERTFRSLENEQPALAAFLAGELADLQAPAAQAVAFYLFLAVSSAFRSAFGTRLHAIAESDIEGALDLLLADGEVRSQTCPARSFSQDRVACLQPALMDALMDELDVAHAAFVQNARSPKSGDDEAAPSEVDPILQTLLVQIVALTRAVAPA
jgi:hypothetical protein